MKTINRILTAVLILTLFSCEKESIEIELPDIDLNESMLRVSQINIVGNTTVIAPSRLEIIEVNQENKILIIKFQTNALMADLFVEDLDGNTVLLIQDDIQCISGTPCQASSYIGNLEIGKYRLVLKSDHDGDSVEFEIRPTVSINADSEFESGIIVEDDDLK